MRYCAVFGACCGAALSASVARASLTLLPSSTGWDRANNLVFNGSFEVRNPGATRTYWATGTTHTPFQVPSGWSSSGGGLNYATWGHDSPTPADPPRLAGSDVLPDGQAALYFGNWLAGVNRTPTFHPDGTVTFSGPPTFNYYPGYDQPVSLWQSVHTQVIPSDEYYLSFWVSGEDAGSPSNWPDSFFAFEMTNVEAGDPVHYLTVPGGPPAGSSSSRRYDFVFTPLNPTLPVQVKFTNTGHTTWPGFSGSGPSELVLDDVIVTPAHPPHDGAPDPWYLNGSGTWLDPGNWQLQLVPFHNNLDPRFGSVITGPCNVTLDVNVIVGRITFDNIHKYTIEGDGILTLGDAGAGIDVLVGSHAITAALALQADASIVTSAGTALSLATLDGGPHALTKSGPGQLSFNHLSAGAITLSAGLTALTGSTPSLRATSLTLGGTPSSPTAKLDLGSGAVAIDYSGPVGSAWSDLAAILMAGRNGLDRDGISNWNGNGIVSSAARANSVGAGFDLYTVASLRNGDLADPNIGREPYTQFAGMAIDASSLLLRYTYAGDADLNGFVDGDDYALIDNAFNGLIPNFGWLSGDFNFDGLIDGDDYALIDSGFLFQGTPIPAPATSAVPEPAMLGAFALNAAGLLGCRRRR